MQATKENKVTKRLAKKNGKGRSVKTEAEIRPASTVQIIEAGVTALPDWPARIAELEATNGELRTAVDNYKTNYIRHYREYAPYIDPPMAREQQEDLWQQAAKGDKPTIESWRDIWIKNVQANYARFGGFRSRGIAKLYQSLQGGTCVVAGSGPHLKQNAHLLKNKPDCIKVVSALHNYAYLEDLGIKVDYYMTLDAGPVVIPEVYESGSVKRADGTIDEDHYWATTKHNTLVAFIGTDPALFDKWQGEIYLFSSPIPDPKIYDALEIEPMFHEYISAGGNVLGGSTYFARCVLGCINIVWIGNSQSFDHEKNFYGWASPHNGDVGIAMRVRDVYAYPVYTWASYWNFKLWFDLFSVRIPGMYINCTEGGIVGAWPEGNIRSVRQMPLASVLETYTCNEYLRPSMEGKTEYRQGMMMIGQ